MNKITISIVFLLLSACSGKYFHAHPEKPSDSEIEILVTKSLLSGWGEGMYDIENLKKVDGFKKDIKTYVAYIEYDMVFKVDHKTFRKGMKLKKESKESPLISIFSMLFSTLEFGNFEKGDRLTREWKVTFINAEKGWRIGDDVVSSRAEEREDSKKPLLIRSSKEVRETIKSNNYEFSGIYKRRLLHNPIMEGKVTLKFSIFPSGKVERVEVVSSEIDDKEFIEKLIYAGERIDFGDKKNVNKFTFVVPINFQRPQKSDYNVYVKKNPKGAYSLILSRNEKESVVFRSRRGISMPELSDDGKYIAYISNEREKPALMVQSLRSGRRITAIESVINPVRVGFSENEMEVVLVKGDKKIEKYDYSKDF